MYVSMTGFGGASLEREWGTVTLELSSVNHRYQEIHVRLPKELSAWEPWFHQKLRGFYRRGKVQARVEILWAASAQAAPLNAEVLASYYRELSALAGTLGAPGVSLDTLTAMPGVLDVQGRVRLARDEAVEDLLSELLDLGAASWNEMRRTEGEHLRAAIEEHVAALEDLCGRISGLWADAKEAAYAAMIERVQKALEGAGLPSFDDARFAQEAVLLADRWDVSEELARLTSHIAKFRETGGGAEPSGRKLDFLVQEMNREVNTIGSKVSDADIRWLTVEAKAAIERAREQVQNLE
jgi:TIGR00255 family protein